MDTANNLHNRVGGAYGGGEESSLQPGVQARCSAVSHRERDAGRQGSGMILFIHLSILGPPTRSILGALADVAPLEKKS